MSVIVKTSLGKTEDS